MKLYFNPQSRAVMAKWMLDECGADYELVPIDFKKGDNKSPEFLDINPSGKLPTLVDGENRIFESSAIGLYLAEKFPEAGLAPEPGSVERGRYLSLMVYATSQLEPAMGDTLMKQETSPVRGWTDFERAQDLVEKELGEGPYLFGQQFTMADIMVGAMFIWKRAFDPEQVERPRITTYVEALQARPHAVRLG